MPSCAVCAACSLLVSKALAASPSPALVDAAGSYTCSCPQPVQVTMMNVLAMAANSLVLLTCLVLLWVQIWRFCRRTSSADAALAAALSQPIQVRSYRFLLQRLAAYRILLQENNEGAGGYGTFEKAPSPVVAEAARSSTPSHGPLIITPSIRSRSPSPFYVPPSPVHLYSCYGSYTQPPTVINPSRGRTRSRSPMFCYLHSHSCHTPPPIVVGPPSFSHPESPVVVKDTCLRSPSYSRSRSPTSVRCSLRRSRLRSYSPPPVIVNPTRGRTAVRMPSPIIVQRSISPSIDSVEEMRHMRSGRERSRELGDTGKPECRLRRTMSPPLPVGAAPSLAPACTPFVPGLRSQPVRYTPRPVVVHVPRSESRSRSPSPIRIPVARSSPLIRTCVIARSPSRESTPSIDICDLDPPRQRRQPPLGPTAGMAHPSFSANTGADVFDCPSTGPADPVTAFFSHSPPPMWPDLQPAIVPSRTNAASSNNVMNSNPPTSAWPGFCSPYTPVFVPGVSASAFDWPPWPPLVSPIPPLVSPIPPPPPPPPFPASDFSDNESEDEDGDERNVKAVSDASGAEKVTK
jgi:hypothetical protein